LLTDFGKATLSDRYYIEGETKPDDLFHRVASAYGTDADHSARIYGYMSKLWFLPATPILSNAGTGRGLPISCFLNTAGDSMGEIVETYNENIELSRLGGGLGTYWGSTRSVGEPVGQSGHTSGIVPFIKVQDSLSLAISQGSLRRGSAAVYLDVWHPEIEEFIDLRRPTGDINRRSTNLHHGINISDAFMWAVKTGAPWYLLSPHSGEVLRTVNARELWGKILETRLETGEPYLNFIDTVNDALPAAQKELGLVVRQSNLCTEITLPTSSERTAVCCLGSLNLAKWSEYSDQIDGVVRDCLEFLDNVLTDFALRTTIDRARYSVERERAVGLGVMGFHTFLQQNLIPFGSVMSKVWNGRIFKTLRRSADRASSDLAELRGSCPDVPGQRFSHKLAIAPTANISIICGGVSAGIEPVPANIYTHKTLSGSFVVRNPELERHIGSSQELWDSILKHEGSVQHLDIDPHLKEVFRTAFEIDQRWVVELANDRAPEICQSQSVNLFLPADIHKQDLHHLHWTAWEGGTKSLYYLRSKSMKRATHVQDNQAEYNTEECLACQ
jgi:ribonucleoside-diphosphate reductase alpha chain